MSYAPFKTLAMVPVLTAAMNASPPPPGADLSSLEHALIGAAPLSDTILAAFLKNVKHRAHPKMSVRQVYGLTETCKDFFLFIVVFRYYFLIPYRLGFLHRRRWQT